MERDILDNLTLTLKPPEPEPEGSKEPEWLASLLEDCENEGVVLTRSKIIRHRGFIFQTCTKFGYREFGISGLTCRIMEQYLGHIIDVASRIEDTIVRKQFYTSMVHSRVLLIMVCSMQLAAKMNAVGPSLRMSTLRSLLILHKYPHTVEELKKTELDIFLALDHRVPRWSGVQITGLLISEVTDDDTDFDTANSLIHMAEYNRYKIEMILLLIANINPDIPNTRVRTLHLGAGCVAGAMKLNQREKDPIPYLAKLINVSCSYIEFIRDVVLKETMSNPIQHTPAIPEVETNKTLKRKIDTDEEPSTSKKKPQ